MLDNIEVCQAMLSAEQEVNKIRIMKQRKILPFNYNTFVRLAKRQCQCVETVLRNIVMKLRWARERLCAELSIRHSVTPGTSSSGSFNCLIASINNSYLQTASLFKLNCLLYPHCLNISE